MCSSDLLKARSACVVLAARGYPEKAESGQPITGIDSATAMDGVEVFHAGTAVNEGKFVTGAGRVLAVTALGATFAQARERCYAAAETVRFEGRHFRTDIANDALEGAAG